MGVQKFQTLGPRWIGDLGWGGWGNTRNTHRCQIWKL